MAAGSTPGDADADDGVGTEAAGGGVDLDEVARRELDGLDPYGFFDREAVRVSAFLHGLDDDGWAVPTRCEGWDRRALAAHLAGVEEYHHACLDDRVGELFERAAAAGVTGLHDFNELGVRERADRPAEDVVAEWESADAETRRRFRALGDGTVATSVGPYPARWQAFHIASELAIHADDLGVPVPEDERADRLAWRVGFSRFALAEAKVDVDVDLDGLDDAVLVEGVAGRLADGHPLRERLSTMP